MLVAAVAVVLVHDDTAHLSHLSNAVGVDDHLRLERLVNDIGRRATDGVHRAGALTAERPDIRRLLGPRGASLRRVAWLLLLIQHFTGVLRHRTCVH